MVGVRLGTEDGIELAVGLALGTEDGIPLLDGTMLGMEDGRLLPEGLVLGMVDGTPLMVGAEMIDPVSLPTAEGALRVPASVRTIDWQPQAAMTSPNVTHSSGEMCPRSPDSCNPKQVPSVPRGVVMRVMRFVTRPSSGQMLQAGKIPPSKP